MSTSKTKRQYRTAKEWQVLLDQFDQSELSQSEFCRQHSLTLSAFHNWRKKLVGEPKLRSADPFIELAPPVEPNPVTWDVELELGGGRILRLRVS